MSISRTTFVIAAKIVEIIEKEWTMIDLKESFKMTN